MRAASSSSENAVITALQTSAGRRSSSATKASPLIKETVPGTRAGNGDLLRGLLLAYCFTQRTPSAMTTYPDGAQHES